MQQFLVRPNRTYCQTDEVLSLIDNVTSFFEDGYFYSPKFRRHVWDGKRHLYRKADKSFPTGLLSRVVSALDKKGLQYSIEEDLSTGKIEGYKGLHELELRDYQIEAMESGIANRRGMFGMSTNSGKTPVMAALAQRIREPVLILTHRLELLEQTSRRLTEWLQEPVEVVGDSAWGDTARIVVAMVPTLASRMKGETKEAKRIRTEWINKFGLLMIDEAHHAASTTWYDIALKCKAPFRFGLSGTPFRADNKDMMLEAATGPIIYTITNKDMINAGVSVEPIVRFIPISQPVLESTLKWPDAYHNGIVVNSFRNGVAVDLATHYSLRGLRVLILVVEIDHGKCLQDTFEERNIGAKFIHGSNDTEYRQKAIEEFKQGSQLILIASKILDEGIDIPTIDVLIMLGGGKSPIGLLQRIGRGLRWKESGKLLVYDFLDLEDVDRDPPKRRNQKPKHGFLTLHGIERYSYLKEQPGFEVTLDSSWNLRSEVKGETE